MRWNRPITAGRQPVSAAILLALLGTLLATGQSRAQQPGPPYPSPRLLVVTPPGGKAGTTFEVSVAGQDLDDAQALVFSQAGIKAQPIVMPPPPPADPKKPAPKPPAKIAILRFQVTIAADAPVGIHDVRLVNSLGISNARAFAVGDLPEILEKEPNNDVSQAQRVDLNSTINGTVANPTDVDYFVFSGQKGQRIILSCLASSIDSRLQPTLELYDSNGKWLGANRSYQQNDALLDCTLASDGDYFVRLSQFTYTQGSPEHFYRLTITTAPWIDAIFPPMVEPGKVNEVIVFGRNLPGGKLDSSAVLDGRVLERTTVTVDVPSNLTALQSLSYSGAIPPGASNLDGFEYRLHNAAGASNPFLLTYATAPVVLDNEKNDAADEAQGVTLPCEIAGRIEKRRDRDWYAFKASKGQVYTIEVLSERLGAPTDIYFTLRNPATKQEFTEQDDNPETLSRSKFFTSTKDPARYRFVAPVDGTYQIMVSARDASNHAGPRQLYRLRIGPEQPDFRLIVMPQGATNPTANVLRQGGEQYFDVFAWRQDGLNGDIGLTIEGLPAGVTCLPQRIGPGLKYGMLVVSAAPGAAAWTGSITVKGAATIHGQPLVREARPAAITWPLPQPNLVAVSRLDRQLVLAVREGVAPFHLEAGVDHPRILQGEKATVSLKLHRLLQEFNGPVQVAPMGTPPDFALPPNVTINNNQPFTMAPGKNDATVVLEARANAFPGTYTIALGSQGQMPIVKDAASQQKMNVVVLQPTTPVTVTILPKQLATLTLGTNNLTIQQGMQAEVAVRATRLFDYAGEFKVQLILPTGAAGVRAEELVIPAGKEEGKLLLKADADAVPGTRANVLVRATALFDGTVPTIHEAKMNVNVVKK